MEKQEYTIIDHLDLDNTIRENLSNLLKSVKENTVSVNKGIDNIARQILDTFDEFDEKDYNYFTGLPGQKISIIDNTFSVTNEDYIDFLKTHKYVWFSAFYSDLQKDNIKKLAEYIPQGKKPVTRSSIRMKDMNNAIFFDQYNNPIIFVKLRNGHTPSTRHTQLYPWIFYFKVNAIEFPKTLFNLRNVLIGNRLLDDLAKQIMLSVIFIDFCNFSITFDLEKHNPNVHERQLELNDCFTKIENLNYCFSKLKMLLDVVEQHKSIVDKSNELNALIKRYRLLESNYITLKDNHKTDQELLTNFKVEINDNKKKINKFQEFHTNTIKENLELKKRVKKLRRSKNSLSNWNIIYLMLLLVTGTIILLLDLTYSPNKEHVFNKVSEYIIYKLNNLEL